MVRPLFRFRALPADAAPAAAPDIGAIEASLRNCSIARRHARGYGHHHHRPHVPAAADHDDITVELNSEVPLPGNWEQVLNIQTGEIHYINRADGTKTHRDPRLRGCYAASPNSAESEPESLVYDADANDTSSDDTSYYTTSSSDSSGGGHNHSSTCRHSDSPESSSSSSSSSTLSTATTVGGSTASSAESSAEDSDAAAASAGAVLVLVGCRLCFTLSMVPRRGEECPKCGGSLLLRF